MQKTFVILDTPPNEHNLLQEQSVSRFSEIIPPLVTLLKRDPHNDIITMLGRVHSISSRGNEAHLGRIVAEDAKDFPKLAKTGDRLVVLKQRAWDQYLVT
ncbi:MAG: hypothetical protein Q7R64_02360 [bacterium]|nr:hypothetical protein [bacterium]